MVGLETIFEAIARSDTLVAAILLQPIWLQAWVGWMVAVNLLGSLIFLKARVEAKWVFLAFLAAAFMMEAMYHQYGFQRILGLPHIIFWTPLVIYLWRRQAVWERPGLSPKWLAVVFVTNVTSLIIDYIDVARYLSGERQWP